MKDQIRIFGLAGGSPLAKVLLVLCGLVYLYLRLLLLRERYFDTDELEHLHAALCVARGGVLYKDFFELHGPLFYFFLAPFVGLLHDPLSMIWTGRAITALFWLGILTVQWQLSNHLWTRFEKFLSILFLASYTTFAMKSLEIRPDLPAVFLLSLAYLLLRRHPDSFKKYFFIGTALGVSILFSLKAIFGAAGVLAAIIFEAIKTKSVQTVRKKFLILPGIILPILLVVLYFLSKEALRDFYQCFYLFNARFHGGFPVKQFLLPSIKENMVLWVLGGSGFFWAKKDIALFFPFLVTLAGLAITPSSYAQSYLFVGPLLSFSATVSSVHLFQKIRTSSLYALRGAKFLIPAILIPSFVTQSGALKIRNTKQIEHMECVARQTAPADRVFDIWSGEAFFRPHASYFWFLPEDVYAMFDSHVLGIHILRGLSDKQCRALIWDNYYLAQLPTNIRDFARNHFHDSGCGRLFLRNDNE